MATTDEYEYPTSDQVTNWDSSTEGSYFAAVDDDQASPDDASTYIRHNGSNQNVDLPCPAPTLTDADSVNYVLTRVRLYDGGATGGGARPLLYVNSTRYGSGSSSPGATWTNYDRQDNTNPDTAASWLIADAKGVGSNPLDYPGSRALCGVGEEIDCTQIFLRFNFEFTAAGGGVEIFRRRIEGY